ncbi:hypothetical protein DdX_22092 [Ditylenchus destructor]|uniref:Secreted protein n=1 Tax=Ditylenchus destructor TaxID=166010 RepID=A0AAD4QV34_9BILA|nr:hypothetical protein DdX_22092 [Ditylenchus destructor]
MMRPRKISAMRIIVLAFLADRAHLHHHELALGVGAFGEVDDLHHLDQPVQVLGDLLDHVVRTVVTMVMRERLASSVGATVSDSML